MSPSGMVEVRCLYMAESDFLSYRPHQHNKLCNGLRVSAHACSFGSFLLREEVLGRHFCARGDLAKLGTITDEMVKELYL